MSERLTESEVNDLYSRWLQKTSFTHLTTAVERILTDRLLAARGAGDGPVEMYLCESARVMLQPGRLYRFDVDPECADCKAAAEPYALDPGAQGADEGGGS